MLPSQVKVLQSLEGLASNHLRQLRVHRNGTELPTANLDRLNKVSVCRIHVECRSESGQLCARQAR